MSALLRSAFTQHCTAWGHIILSSLWLLFSAAFYSPLHCMGAYNILFFVAFYSLWLFIHPCIAWKYIIYSHLCQKSGRRLQAVQTASLDQSRAPAHQVLLLTLPASVHLTCSSGTSPHLLTSLYLNHLTCSPQSTHFTSFTSPAYQCSPHLYLNHLTCSSDVSCSVDAEYLVHLQLEVRMFPKKHVVLMF